VRGVGRARVCVCVCVFVILRVRRRGVYCPTVPSTALFLRVPAAGAWVALAALCKLETAPRKHPHPSPLPALWLQAGSGRGRMHTWQRSWMPGNRLLDPPRARPASAGAGCRLCVCARVWQRDQLAARACSLLLLLLLPSSPADAAS
jgi:hypothetical protein